MKKMITVLLACTACATAPKPAPAASEPVKSPPKVVKLDEASASHSMQDDIDALLKGLAIHFAFDRADLTADSQKRLDVLAEKMRSNPNVHIKVSGNCDDLGTTEYNLALGQRRADAVKTYLGHLGIEGGRVETVSYGEEKPLDPAPTDAARAVNRRDDIEKKAN
jgi:peptidoglycan-associated lipoprotein